MPRGVPRNRGEAPGDSETPVQPDASAFAAAVPEPDAVFVTPYIESPQAAAPAVLTPDQQMINELRNQLALERGKKDGEPELDPVAMPGSADNIIIHFLEDGFTACGQIWYRGQELEFEVGSQAYRDTFDRLGRSWLDLRDDEFAQVEKWDKVMFRVGPWPGKRLADAKITFEAIRNDSGGVVAPPTVEELAKADAAELKRKRAAPKLSPMG